MGTDRHRGIEWRKEESRWKDDEELVDHLSQRWAGNQGQAGNVGNCHQSTVTRTVSPNKLEIGIGIEI
jgi:hypothetical protein